MSETDLRRYEGQLIVWESIPGFRGNSYFVDFGVKTYVSIYQEPASGVGYSVPVPPMLFDPGMANSFTGMENIISIEYRISSINRTAVFKKASDYKLPAQSYEAPKSVQKKKRQTNLRETFIQSHLSGQLPSVSRLPSFHHETTLSCPSSKPPLPIKIRRGKWRNLAVVSLKRRTNFRTKISPTKNSCGGFLCHVYGLSRKLMAPKCFKKLLLLQSQRDKDTNKSSLCSNPFHPFPKDKNPPTESLLSHLSTRGFRLPKKMFVSCDPHLIFLHNIRICFAVKSCVFYFRSLPPKDALEENLLGL